MQRHCYYLQREVNQTVLQYKIILFGGVCMTTKNLYEGQRIKNYPELCKLLEERPRSGGNSKRSHLKEFERFFAFHKVGNTFIITKIHENPKLHNDQRMKYARYFEPILLNLLCNYQSLEESMKDWLIMLDMVSREVFYHEMNEYIQDEYRTSSFIANKTLSDLKLKANQIFRQELKRLSKKGIICYEEKTYIVKMNGRRFVASTEDKNKLLSVRMKALADCGYATFYETYINPKKWKKYLEKLSERMKKNGWMAYYKSIYISCIDTDYVSLYQDVDTADYRRNLNSEIKNAVRKSWHAQTILTDEDYDMMFSDERPRFRLNNMSEGVMGHILDSRL